jgi:hypothetical protein
MQKLAGFDEGASTTGTNMYALFFALIKHPLFLNVGLPLPIGSLF